MTTILVPGGPGLDSSYLLPWFKPVVKEVVGFDPSGCGVRAGETDCSLKRDVALLVALIEQQKGPVELIAHSWGTIPALLTAKQVRLKRVVLVGPCALERGLFMRGPMRLWERVPAGVKQEYAQAIGEGRAVEGFNLILPFYLGKVMPKGLRISGFWPKVNAQVLASAGNYNLEDVNVGCPVEVILGEEDVIKQEDHLGLQCWADRFVLMPGVGHFPFAEDPEDFFEVLG
jgi:pimeloyl-ACP methyl ester carboxylesterase